MPLFAIPPVPPPPPAITRCATAEGHAVPECAQYTYEQGGRSIDARFVGDVRIDVKSDEVLTVPAGASAAIEERRGKSSRRLTIEDGKSTFLVDGLDRPIDSAARQWLREVLSTMPDRPIPPPKPSR